MKKATRKSIAQLCYLHDVKANTPWHIALRLSQTLCVIHAFKVGTHRCQINSPSLLSSQFFPTPRTLSGPPFINFRDNDVFHEFLSLLEQIMPTFQDKLAFVCLCFSLMPYDNLFLFIPSPYNLFKPFLKSLPPCLF